MIHSQHYHIIMQGEGIGEGDLDRCREIYRWLHGMPEIGLEEYNTAMYIRELLREIEGIVVDEPLEELKTAIVVRIEVEKPERCILLRCELDALNWPEKSGLPFSSNNQLHHACGHDGHMATMIKAIEIAARNRHKLMKNLVFCFQPGQQGKGGAKKLFQAKPDLLDNVDECYALHFRNDALPGKIFLSKGPVTALSAKLHIKIAGKSAHLMLPYVGIDANFIGCTLVTQLYSLIGMKVPPLEGATLVVYNILGGSNGPKVSDSFQLTASVRTTTLASFQALKSTIISLSEGLCLTYGAPKPQVTFDMGNYRPVVNDESLVISTKKRLISSIPSLIIDDSQKSFAGQDFCEFSQKRPSCYIGVGSALPDSFDPLTNQSQFPIHSPFHKLDQTVFQTSLSLWQAIMFN